MGHLLLLCKISYYVRSTEYIFSLTFSHQPKEHPTTVRHDDPCSHPSAVLRPVSSHRCARDTPRNLCAAASLRVKTVTSVRANKVPPFPCQPLHVAQSIDVVRRPIIKPGSLDCSFGRGTDDSCQTANGHDSNPCEIRKYDVDENRTGRPWSQSRLLVFQTTPKRHLLVEKEKLDSRQTDKEDAKGKRKKERDETEPAKSCILQLPS